MYHLMKTTTRQRPTPPHLGKWRAGLIAAIIAINATLVGLGFASTAPSQATVSVAIGNTLQPASLTVTPGTTILFQNIDDERHRMRSHSGPATFDTDTLRPGESAAVVMSVEGTYLYSDHRRGSDHGEHGDDNEHGDHHGHHQRASYEGTIIVTSDATLPDGRAGAVTPPAPATATVALAGTAFTPRTVTVAAGGTVTWNNNDDRPHTVTASDASFDSGILARGATFERTFATPGTYAYVCDLHSGMSATVVVTAAGTTPPPTTPPPTTPPPTTPPRPLRLRPPRPRRLRRWPRLPWQAARSPRGPSRSRREEW